MTEKVKVVLSGPAFSFLLYENVRSNADQEGFLLGTIQRRETKTITDNDHEQFHVETLIKVNGTLACVRTSDFYDSIGRVDQRKINSILGNLRSKVIGWYRYRSLPNLSLTLREKLVHKELIKVFDADQKLFVCCLLTSEVNDSCSTHSFSQNFLRYTDSCYEPLPVHIMNLSNPDQGYRSEEQVTGALSKIFNKAAVDVAKSRGSDVIVKIHEKVQAEINKVASELAEKESYMFRLEQEIKELRKSKASITEDKEDVEEATNSMDKNDIYVEKEASSEGSLVSITPKSSPELPRKRIDTPIKKAKSQAN